MATDFYVWRRPLDFAPPLDHTWVTTYQPVATCPPDDSLGDYWYCWGVCHETGPGTNAELLHYGVGDLERAHCLDTPNDSDSHAGIPGFYGEYGVCHQVANRMLFATEGPLTIKGANGWFLSYLVYGWYGGPEGNWEERKHQCGLAQKAEMTEKDLDEELLEQALGKGFQPAKLQELAEIKDRIRVARDQLAQQVHSGQLTVEEYARAVNELLTDTLPDLARLVGADKAKAMFGVEPGEDVVLLDPNIAQDEDKK